MNEFLLRYRLPEGCVTDWQEEKIRRQAWEMAKQIQAKAEDVFHTNVAYGVREFGHCDGMASFDVTGWITNNNGSSMVEDEVESAQREFLALMKSLAFEYQVVECKWLIVKSSGGYAQGEMKQK